MSTKPDLRVEACEASFIVEDMRALLEALARDAYAAAEPRDVEDQEPAALEAVRRYRASTLALQAMLSRAERHAANLAKIGDEGAGEGFPHIH